MGFSISWIAVKGVDKGEALTRLGVVDTGEEAEEDAYDFSFAALPDGWLLILSDDFNYPNAERMAAISTGGEAIAFVVEEHVMYSAARCYRDGSLIWSIDHDGGDKGVHHLDVAGDPPPELGPIHERLSQEQAEEDAGDAMADCIFDVPVELSEALCGYRHDQVRPEGEELTFTLLRYTTARLRRVTSGGGLFKSIAGLFKRD
jgi:hypothetical protein